MRQLAIIAVIAVLASCKGGESKPSAKPTGANGIDLSRVMVIGASMSAGFGGVRLDALLGEVIKADHDMASATSIFFSTDAIAYGKRQIDKATAFKPTLTIALDFVFWYAYANTNRDQRTKRVGQALRLLETLPGTVVVGDLADMRNADPSMMPPSAVPPPAQLAAFNRQIHAWARGKKRVHVIPFSEWARPLLSGGSVVVTPGSPAIAANKLLAPDRLHPNGDGMRYIVRRLVENLHNAFPDTPKNALRSN